MSGNLEQMGVTRSLLWLPWGIVSWCHQLNHRHGYVHSLFSCIAILLLKVPGPSYPYYLDQGSTSFFSARLELQLLIAALSRDLLLIFWPQNPLLYPLTLESVRHGVCHGLGCRQHLLFPILQDYSVEFSTSVNCLLHLQPKSALDFSGLRLFQL